MRLDSCGPSRPDHPADGHLHNDTISGRLEQWDGPANRWRLVTNAELVELDAEQRRREREREKERRRLARQAPTDDQHRARIRAAALELNRALQAATDAGMLAGAGVHQHGAAPTVVATAERGEVRRHV